MAVMKRLLVSPYIGRRWRCLLVALLVCSFLWMALVARNMTALNLTILPPVTDRDLTYLRHSRQLSHYLDKESEPLISPQAHACEGHETVPVVILVSSSPNNIEERDIIRSTWGHEQPTYFFIGRIGPGRLNMDEQLVENYIEAKQNGDLVVGDYIDSYENLTLKSMHMLQWSVRHCPLAEFVFKTDDDVFVNPWTLMQVLKDNMDAKLIGYQFNQSAPHRDKENKWYVPRWLYPEPRVPEYLSGTGYIINGEYLNKIYEASYEVPLINLEDIFITYLVSKQNLGLTLTHEPRLSPYHPLVSTGCACWNMASMHSLKPKEIWNLWPKIRALAEQYQENKNPCRTFDRVFGFLSWPMFLVA